MDSPDPITPEQAGAGAEEARAADPECIFCRIVAGELPSRQVYADDTCVAFLDLSPLATGHTLVVPRRHVESLLADPAAFAEVAPAVGVVARRLVDALDADGCNVLTSSGAVAGQEVFHLHVHVVPRYADAPGLRHLFDGSDADLDEVHSRITAAHS